MYVFFSLFFCSAPPPPPPPAGPSRTPSDAFTVAYHTTAIVCVWKGMCASLCLCLCLSLSLRLCLSLSLPLSVSVCLCLSLSLCLCLSVCLSVCFSKRTAGLLVSETFCLALVSDTFGYNKAIELSSQYSVKDLQIYIYIYIPKQEWSASVLQKDMYAKYRDFKTFFWVWEVLWVCWYKMFQRSPGEVTPRFVATK